MPDHSQIKPAPSHSLWAGVNPPSPETYAGLKHSKPPTGAELRDDAIQRAADHADAAWLDSAYRAGVHVCQTKARFTVDDIQAVLSAAGVAPPREGRAMGAVLVRMRRDGLCEATGEYRASDQPQCHRNPRSVWKSLAIGTKKETV